MLREKTRIKVRDMAEQLGYIYRSNNPEDNQIINIALIASDFAFSQTFFGHLYIYQLGRS